MKIWSKACLALVALLGLAVVFSPLVAALAGIDPRSAQGSILSVGIGRPLALSAACGLAAALVALVLGVPFAILIERARPGPRFVLWALGLFTLIVPPYIAAESWIVLLGPVGVLSKAIALFLGLGPPSDHPLDVARYAVPGFVFTWAGVGIVMGGCLFPVVAMAVASTLRRTDSRVFEAARLVQGPKGVRRVAERLLAPPALGGALLVFAATLMEFAVPQVLRVRTIGEAVYERIQEGELATATLLSVPLLLLVVFSGALGILVLTRGRAASLASLEGEIPKYGAGGGRVGNDLWACLAGILALTPALILTALSLSWLAATASLPQTSALGTHKVLRASGILDSLQGAWELARNDAVRTVVLALAAATLATVIAILFSKLAGNSRVSWLVGVLGAGLAVPAPVVGLGLIALWDHAWSAAIYHTVGMVMLAWSARFLPLTVLIVYGALTRVPRELEDAAALAGRGPWGRFWCATFPNAAPGLAAAWLCTYILSATEFSATLLVAPPGSPLLAPSVVNLMRRGQDPEIAACQLLLMGVVALPLLVPALAALLRLGLTRCRTEAA